MHHKCLTGKKFEGNIKISSHINLYTLETIVDFDLEEINTNETSHFCSKYLIEFTKQLTCTSWEVKVTIDGGEPSYGVAKINKDGILTIKSCISRAAAISAFGAIFSFTAKYYVTLKGKFNKCYNSLYLEVENMSDSDAIAVAEFEGIAFTFCAEELGEGTFKKVC
jgi:hypothetical protein